ncbi:glutamine amidotransferase-like class 1 domain-containing protein 1 isoform X3 [Nycticebus coucang]|nr:glutamine amidotransferase-like class 1 domain-containing protein 1 isoform X3 [Nycticebus coucang]XP_053418742.1 glutamine amidotransferase-like class 1 domain-containing protein 1 isoform X3 [Nycticebus coucang]XP_053418743.1 glutamine amidotransferase-like class 1 domain-containing protein 1 isoform X3 [Nycticebus coucang]
MASTAFNLQVATPGGKTMDFVGVTESNARWVQDFRLKAHANPAKLESIDGARYHALLIPSCPGALVDLVSSGSLARILQHFHSESKPICAVGHGVAALCCATNEDRSWVFHGYSLTGDGVSSVPGGCWGQLGLVQASHGATPQPSVCELVRAPGFARLPLIVEDFVKDSGASFSASEPDATHVVLDRHLVTGQNASSTVPAVQNLLFLCSSRWGMPIFREAYDPPKESRTFTS